MTEEAAMHVCRAVGYVCLTALVVVGMALNWPGLALVAFIVLILS